MPVTGGREVAARLRAIPKGLRERVADALEDGASAVLADMVALTPIDNASRDGKHARDGLTAITDRQKLVARIGLPSAGLASDYFWFRFLDGGTKGGEVTYRRAGSPKLHTMTVPARPALRIRERALDGNINEIDTIIRKAVRDGLKEA